MTEIEEVIQPSRPEVASIPTKEDIFNIGGALKQYDKQKQNFQDKLADLTKLGISYSTIKANKQLDGCCGEFLAGNLDSTSSQQASGFSGLTGFQSHIPFFPSLNVGDREAANVTYGEEKGTRLFRYKFIAPWLALGRKFFEKFWEGRQAKGQPLFEGSDIQYAKFLRPQDDPNQSEQGDLPSVHMIKAGPSKKEIILGTGHVAEENDPKVIELVRQALAVDLKNKEGGQSDNNIPPRVMVFRQGSKVTLNDKTFHLEASMSVVDTDKVLGAEAAVTGKGQDVTVGASVEGSIGPSVGTRITFPGVEINTFMAKFISQEVLFADLSNDGQEVQNGRSLWLQKIEKPDGQVRFEDYVKVQEGDNKAIVVYVRGKPAFIFDGLETPQAKKMFYSIMLKLASDFKALHPDIYEAMRNTAHSTDQPVFLKAGQYGFEMVKEVREDRTVGKGLIPKTIVKFPGSPTAKENTKELLTKKDLGSIEEVLFEGIGFYPDNRVPGGVSTRRWYEYSEPVSLVMTREKVRNAALRAFRSHPENPLRNGVLRDQLERIRSKGKLELVLEAWGRARSEERIKETCCLYELKQHLSLALRDIFNLGKNGDKGLANFAVPELFATYLVLGGALQAIYSKGAREARRAFGVNIGRERKRVMASLGRESELGEHSQNPWTGSIIEESLKKVMQGIFVEKNSITYQVDGEEEVLTREGLEAKVKQVLKVLVEAKNK